jgi:predicted RNase H-like nuclease
VRRLPALADLFDDTPFDIVAVDVPLGLLDAYEVGGRACDRAARKLLINCCKRAPTCGAPSSKCTPEVCFCELVGKPMIRSKGKSAGCEERRAALGRALPQVDTIINEGRELRLPIEDILDATVACLLVGDGWPLGGPESSSCSAVRCTISSAVKSDMPLPADAAKAKLLANKILDVSTDKAH